MGPAQQIVLPVMLDNDPTFRAQQDFTGNAAIAVDRPRCRVFARGQSGGSCVVHSQDSVNENSYNNNNHYHQSEIFGQALFVKKL